MAPEWCIAPPASRAREVSNDDEESSVSRRRRGVSIGGFTPATIHVAKLMTRPVTLFTGQWADLPLETLAAKAAEWGYDGLELASWGDHFDVERALSDDAYCRGRHDLLARHGLKVWAISNHLVGQAVCDDPIDQRHKDILPAAVWGDGEPEGVRQRAARRMQRCAVVEPMPQQCPEPAAVRPIRLRRAAVRRRRSSRSGSTSSNSSGLRTWHSCMSTMRCDIWALNPRSALCPTFMAFSDARRRLKGGER